MWQTDNAQCNRKMSQLTATLTLLVTVAAPPPLPALQLPISFILAAVDKHHNGGTSNLAHSAEVVE